MDHLMQSYDFQFDTPVKHDDIGHMSTNLMQFVNIKFFPEFDYTVQSDRDNRNKLVHLKHYFSFWTLTDYQELLFGIAVFVMFPVVVGFLYDLMIDSFYVFPKLRSTLAYCLKHGIRKLAQAKADELDEGVKASSSL